MSHFEYDIENKNDTYQLKENEYTAVNGKYWEYKRDENENKPFIHLLKGNQDYPTWITSDIKEMALYIIENLLSYNKYSTTLQQTLKQAVDAVFNEYSEIKYSELLNNINNIFNLFFIKNYNSSDIDTAINILISKIEIHEKLASINKDKVDSDQTKVDIWQDLEINAEEPLLKIYRQAFSTGDIDDEVYSDALLTFMSDGNVALNDKEKSDYNQRIKDKEDLFKSYKEGIEKVNSLISANNINPGIPIIHPEINQSISIGDDILLALLAKEEVALKKQHRTEYSQKDILDLQTLQAAKYHLLVLSSLGALLYQIAPKIGKMTQGHGDYRDIIFAQDQAELLFKKNNIHYDTDHVLYQESKHIEMEGCIILTAAIIYRMRKENANVEQALKYSTLETIKLFENDKQKLNPFNKNNVKPAGYFSFIDFKKRDKFDSQYNFNEQFNVYKNKYSDYESILLSKLILSSPAAQLTTEEIVNPPEEAFLYSVEQGMGNVAMIKMYQGNWLVVSTIQGGVKARKYSQQQVDSQPTLRAMSRPNALFLIEQKIEIGMGILMANRMVRTGKRLFPIGYERAKTLSGFSETSRYKYSYDAFWNDYYGITSGMNVGISFTGSPKFNFYKEDNLLSVTTTIVQKGLNDIAIKSKQALDITSGWHIAATILIPFYNVIYKATTDSEYTLTGEDVGSIIFDTANVLLVVATLGMSLTESMAAKVTQTTLRLRQAGLTGRALITAVIRTLPEHGVITLRQSSRILLGGLIDLIEPLPIRSTLTLTYRGVVSAVGVIKNSIKLEKSFADIFSKSTRGLGKLKNEWQVSNISLNRMVAHANEGIYKGIYSIRPANVETAIKQNYYIKESGANYQVKWDETNHTWRVANPAYPQQFSYWPAVKLDKNGHWITHTDVSNKFLILEQSKKIDQELEAARSNINNDKILDAFIHINTAFKNHEKYDIDKLSDITDTLTHFLEKSLKLGDKQALLNTEIVNIQQAWIREVNLPLQNNLLPKNLSISAEKINAIKTELPYLLREIYPVGNQLPNASAINKMALAIEEIPNTPMPKYSSGNIQKTIQYTSIESNRVNIPPIGITITGNDLFINQVTHVLDEISEIPSGNIVIQELEKQGLNIQPPTMDAIVREKNGQFYAHNSAGSSIAFDPENHLIGTEEKLVEEPWRSREPAIALYHEMLHIYYNRYPTWFTSIDNKIIDQKVSGGFSLLEESRIVGTKYYANDKNTLFDFSNSGYLLENNSALLTENRFRAEYAIFKGESEYVIQPYYGKGDSQIPLTSTRISTNESSRNVMGVGSGKPEKMPGESATDYRNRVKEWRKANKKPGMDIDIGSADMRKRKAQFRIEILQKEYPQLEPQKIELGGAFELWTVPNEPANSLMLSSHGYFFSDSAMTQVPAGKTIQFLGPHGQTLLESPENPLNSPFDVTLGNSGLTVQPYATIKAGNTASLANVRIDDKTFTVNDIQNMATNDIENYLLATGVEANTVNHGRVRNYGIKYYEKMPDEEVKAAVWKNRTDSTNINKYDALLVSPEAGNRKKLSDIFTLLKTNERMAKYDEITFVACREELNRINMKSVHDTGLGGGYEPKLQPTVILSRSKRSATLTPDGAIIYSVIAVNLHYNLITEKIVGIAPFLLMDN
ncbi:MULTISPECIES: putative adhesin [Photorhabdus]|uniref:putative adhesin n=1 Tax=Photorhabdus TaxID=29487 RepID=UPI0007B4DC61|nr:MULTISPECIES: M91 family zinc metallopeptidase [Photorhabdus]AWK42176.1 cytotoxic necrotizing factor [Photorhabdus laumondii subsp. laumondii]AXG43036.1 cytotoxic necrotizing factor [Photorhabdus laumondii subsp. laumondii]MCC8390465.1 cytotoxic necrotizing factor [Photorhabdus laumondii]MCZ1249179.1 cytotoxic necrotizing factor [Photorhabdus laumondii subsp. laumondii]NDL18310.1 cytotoxic necrotizing factor [Photorhabdus laumondii subsp. laumondii]